MLSHADGINVTIMVVAMAQSLREVFVRILEAHKGEREIDVGKLADLLLPLVPTTRQGEDRFVEEPLLTPDHLARMQRLTIQEIEGYFESQAQITQYFD